jgi:hypothetical protein
MALNKSLYPNSTQVPNIIIDEMGALSNSELRIILLVTRKTIGWHKETDYLSYSQIIEITGLSKQSVSDGVNGLVQKGLVKRINKEGESLDPVPTGFRGKIFYTLTKQLVKKLDRSKTHNNTGLKNRPNKTNSYKTNKNTVVASRQKLSTIVDKNVDNHRGNGVVKVGDLLAKYKVTPPSERQRIFAPFQEHALRLAEKLKITPDGPWFKLFKDYHNKGKSQKLDSAYSRVVDAGARDVKKLFFWSVGTLKTLR